MRSDGTVSGADRGARNPPRTMRRGRRPKVALVCAGGGFTGAVYEIGCLRALDELFDRERQRPRPLRRDLRRSLRGLAARGRRHAPRDVRGGGAAEPRLAECRLRRHLPLGPRRARRAASARLRECWRGPLRTALFRDGRGWSDVAWSLLQLLPAGLLSTSGIQEYLDRVFRARLGADRFAKLRRELNVVAVDLDSGEAVAFGRRRHRDVAISKAVAASTALPGLYRPVRIAGRDYVDGGVRKTAHINLAIQSGADARDLHQPDRAVPERHVEGRPGRALEQPWRELGARPGDAHHAPRPAWRTGMERYRREHPEVDILLLRADARRRAHVRLQHHALPTCAA